MWRDPPKHSLPPGCSNSEAATWFIRQLVRTPLLCSSPDLWVLRQSSHSHWDSGNLPWLLLHEHRNLPHDLCLVGRPRSFPGVPSLRWLYCTHHPWSPLLSADCGSAIPPIVDVQSRLKDDVGGRNCGPVVWSHIPVAEFNPWDCSSMRIHCRLLDRLSGYAGLPLEMDTESLRKVSARCFSYLPTQSQRIEVVGGRVESSCDASRCCDFAVRRSIGGQ